MLGDRALQAIRASGGNAIGVSDDEALEAMDLLGREGLFIEPSGAVALTALRRLVREGKVDPQERVVCVLTGSGFKDIDPIAQRVRLPKQVAEDYEQMLAASRA